MRASLALLDLGPDTITAAVLGAIYRAPLGEPSPIDFALHLAGPTGAFKTELAALAQAHFGAAFNGRHLPASWADTANMLEKKAFLAKDALLVVDDFAPTGTTTDVQRLHREADRLFRAAGNRAGRARMRADGGSRPTYYPRGMIISTGEDIPSGQSLRARLLVLELTPGEITGRSPSRRRRPTRERAASRPPWRDICAGLPPASTISRRRCRSGSGRCATRWPRASTTGARPTSQPA